MPDAAIRLMLEAKAAALVARDAGALVRLIDDDFVYINAAGRNFDKSGYIDAFCVSGRIVFTQQLFANVAVRLIDGVAVATCNIADRFTVDGRMMNGQYRSLCVFRRAPGDWKWAAGQTTTVAPP